MPYLNLTALSPSPSPRTVEETREISKQEAQAAREWVATLDEETHGSGLYVAVQENSLDCCPSNRHGHLQIRIFAVAPHFPYFAGPPRKKVLKTAWVGQNRDDCRRFTANAKPAGQEEPFGSRHLYD